MPILLSDTALSTAKFFGYGVTDTMGAVVGGLTGLAVDFIPLTKDRPTTKTKYILKTEMGEDKELDPNKVITVSPSDLEKIKISETTTMGCVRIKSVFSGAVAGTCGVALGIAGAVSGAVLGLGVALTAFSHAATAVKVAAQYQKQFNHKKPKNLRP